MASLLTRLEEGQAGLQVTQPAAVQIEAELDLRFFRVATDASNALVTHGESRRKNRASIGAKGVSLHWSWE